MSIFLAALGALCGAGAVTLLYLKWRGALRHPLVVAAGWAGVVAAIALWSLAYEPYIGAPLAVLALTVVALGLVLRGTELRALVRFPETGRIRCDPAERLNWPGTIARTLAILIAAPVVGMVFGLLAWTWSGGHDATRFYWAVFGFVVVFAAVQVWGASARRPWRALGLISVLGLIATAPVIVGAAG